MQVSPDQSLASGDAAAEESEPNPASPKSEEEHPAPEGPAPDACLWLAQRDGQWYRKVYLENLEHHPSYNGAEGWVLLEHLETSSTATPQLVAVTLAASGHQVRVNSQNIFLVAPVFLPRPDDQRLLLVEVQLSPSQGEPATVARLVVDCGCQLEGVLSREFVRRQGWTVQRSEASVRTACGTRVPSTAFILANTHFCPGFTRQVAYGVLDLPGYDGLLGIGFLNQFLPFTITVAAETRQVLLTHPKTQKQIILPGLATTTPVSPAPKAAPNEEIPRLEIQWTPPSIADLEAVVGQIHLDYDAEAAGTRISWESGPDDAPVADDERFAFGSDAAWLDHTFGADMAEGFVFMVAGTADLAENASQKPAPISPTTAAQLKGLLERFKDSVFKECEFPPFPPERVGMARCN